MTGPGAPEPPPDPDSGLQPVPASPAGSARSAPALGRAWAAWGLAVSAYFVAVFHRTSLGVASLAAEHRFHIGASVLATFVAAQLAVYAALQIPTGAMADRFGPRRMLTAALLFLAAGEALFGWGTGVGAALAGRALVGIGDGLTFLNVLRLVQNWFPASRYGMLTALTSLVGGVGQLVSTVPLRLSLVHLGWVATFAGSAAVTAGVAVVIAVTVKDRPDGSTRLPLREPSSMRRSVRHAMRTPGTWRGTWAHFALTGPFVAFTALWGYPFLVRAQHYSGRSASVVLGFVVVSAVVSAPFVGMIIGRAPRARAAAVTASALFLLASWVLVLAWGPGHVPAALVALLVVATGVGGSTSVIAFDLAREANPPERGGAATGVVNIGGFAGAVLADLAIGGVLDLVGHGGRDPGAYRSALVVVPAMVALGLVQFWRLGRRGDRRARRSGVIRRPVPAP
ncbi:MAG TPA: MFS transporter [Acidimicrobiales bacterium]|nr:MFS transporter [Acidimicrobiales bacterium]